MHYVPGIVVNEVAGNPFQPDVQFRGFVASPVAGTPQGLAVYQNGVRINEAFGDTVNWDLIPTAAIRSVTVVTNNPAFGLNALGGAVNVQMKDGFNYHGAEIDTMGGSFGRIQSSAQWGKQIEQFCRLWRARRIARRAASAIFQPPTFAASTATSATRTMTANFISTWASPTTSFGAAATVPVELLQQYWGATYTTPQTTTNRVGYVNLTGKVEATPTWTIEGAAHVRVFDQKMVDGNPTGTQPCAADPTLLCFGDDATPANGLNGVQLANPFASGAVLGEIDRTTTRSTTTGVSLQATNSDQLFGHNNRFVVGASFDSSVTRFSASCRTRHHRPELCRRAAAAYFSGNPAIRYRSARSRSAPPISTAGSMRSIPSTSPMHSRSRRAGGSTTPASRWRTRSAARSTAMRPLTGSIRSSAAPTRSLLS